MKRRWRSGSKGPTLMLTSLLDMFTIILIFLIVSFEAEDNGFKLNPDLTLPESSARVDLKPAVNLAITGNKIFVEDRHIASLVNSQDRPARTPPGSQAGDQEDNQDGIPELAAALKVIYEERFAAAEGAASDGAAAEEAILVVQSDKQIDYRTLYRVLRSAAQAGFFKYRLAMLKNS